MDITYPTPNGIASVDGGPTWEIANLFPSQGSWSEEEFLALPSPNRFELCDGRLEVLPMPTWKHSLIAGFFYRMLVEYLARRDVGQAGMAPLNIRLWTKQIRQPDVVFCFHERIEDYEKTQDGADLAVEVVSPGKANRERDIKVKRSLYAKAGIREYWIIDPQEKTVTLLSLKANDYELVSCKSPGGIAESLLLPGFRISVTKLLQAGQPPKRKK